MIHYLILISNFHFPEFPVYLYEISNFNFASVKFWFEIFALYLFLFLVYFCKKKTMARKCDWIWIVLYLSHKTNKEMNVNGSPLEVDPGNYVT